MLTQAIDQNLPISRTTNGEKY